MSNMKLSAPKKSGNSTKGTPVIAMKVGDFLVEVTSTSEEGDKELKNVAKKLRLRNNAYDGMLMELKESLKDLKGWDGTPDAMEIIQANIADRIEKARSGAKN